MTTSTLRTSAPRRTNIEDVSPVGDAFLRAVTDGIAMRDPYVPEAGKINPWHTDHFHLKVRLVPERAGALCDHHGIDP